jgi:hypothetical protein
MAAAAADPMDTEPKDVSLTSMHKATDEDTDDDEVTVDDEDTDDEVTVDDEGAAARPAATSGSSPSSGIDYSKLDEKFNVIFRKIKTKVSKLGLWAKKNITCTDDSPNWYINFYDSTGIYAHLSIHWGSVGGNNSSHLRYNRFNNHTINFTIINTGGKLTLAYLDYDKLKKYEPLETIILTVLNKSNILKMKNKAKEKYLKYKAKYIALKKLLNIHNK